MNKKTQKTKAFSNIYGYDHIKKELINIHDWLTNKDYLNNPDIMLPRGVIFYGTPGCGKTLFIKEYINLFKTKTFIIDGHKDNIRDEVFQKFQEAKKEPFSLIVIDELDLLISKNPELVRLIQDELDGVSSNKRLLVIAATNSLTKIPEPLLRQGRLDRHIEINRPNKESRKVIFTNITKRLGITVTDLNLDSIALLLSRTCCSDIKAIINDAYLRHGKNLSMKDIEDSYPIIMYGSIKNPKSYNRDLRVAVHEAGHILIAMLSNKYYRFQMAEYNSEGAITKINEVDDEMTTLPKRIDNLKICLAGREAEKVIYKHIDVGSAQDLRKAMLDMKRLVSSSCVWGINSWEDNLKISSTDFDDRSDKVKFANQRKINKEIRKLQKNVYRMLRKRKKQLMLIANMLLDKGRINQKDLLEIGVEDNYVK